MKNNIQVNANTINDTLEEDEETEYRNNNVKTK